MNADEQEIRQMVATWMEATKSGDVDKVLELMTDDVVFLMPNQQMMQGKDTFAAAARAQSAPGGPTFDGSNEIQEIQILGDWAYLWTKIQVTATLPGGDQMQRAGFTMSILKKENGRWLLARDANLLSPLPENQADEPEA